MDSASDFLSIDGVNKQILKKKQSVSVCGGSDTKSGTVVSKFDTQKPQQSKTSHVSASKNDMNSASKAVTMEQLNE